MPRPRIAVFAGPDATILNSEPLVTSNVARAQYGLPLRQNPDGTAMRFDALRPQRLAAPVTVYIDQFSAHPLEHVSADLYAPPDGYLDANGDFNVERTTPSDRPVYRVTLRPEDGLYPLPYMARQANGTAWEDDSTHPFAPAELSRQPFYPDAARLFEEIDRFALGDHGTGSLLSSTADFDFYRCAPPGGYVGEVLGQDFFPYRPNHLLRLPARASLADAANLVQQTLDSGNYAGVLWLEGSPTVEETAYWLGLLVDTTLPIVCCASQRPHGALGNDGDRNIVDAVDYITSKLWADGDGADRIGAVLIQDKRVYTAREAHKVDARPGGYAAGGGTGGIVATMGDPGRPTLFFVPVRHHARRSEVRLSALPESVMGISGSPDGLLEWVEVRIKDGPTVLVPQALPRVSVVKFVHCQADDCSADPDESVGVLAEIERNLSRAPLAGFVGEGLAPYGFMNEPLDAALARAVFSGMPVVNVGRADTEGLAIARPPFISGSNLSAPKARLLLTACLLQLGALPPAVDPRHPTRDEFNNTLGRIAAYQSIFDSH